MLNNVILMGNLGRDPEVAMSQKGRQIARFSLATSSKWKDGTGEWHTRTYWHKIVVFRESTVRWVKDVVKKGDPVWVEGMLTYRLWRDKHGFNHWIASVVIGDSYGRIETLPFRTPSIQEAEDFPEDLPFEEEPFYHQQVQQNEGELK